jgi:hypothetical protein
MICAMNIYWDSISKQHFRLGFTVYVYLNNAPAKRPDDPSRSELRVPDKEKHYGEAREGMQNLLCECESISMYYPNADSRVAQASLHPNTQEYHKCAYEVHTFNDVD